MNEQKKYEVIKYLADHPDANKKRAALQLNCSIVVDLYLNKYYHANLTHCTELLKSMEGISLSSSTVTSVLEEQFILSPMVTKASADIQTNLVSIDDATGTLTGDWFDHEEILNGYYHVFHQTLCTYGILYKFFTDRRTIFTYNKEKLPLSP